MSEKLKACPFCGGDDFLIIKPWGAYSIRCNNCETENGCYETTEEATEAWNTRHDSEEVERLKKGLEDILYKSVNCDIYDLKGIAEKALSKQEPNNAPL